LELNPKLEGLKDINLREIATLLPMVILIFWIGVYPNALLSFMHVSVQHLLDTVNLGTRPETSLASLMFFK
jgi:NADH-quinone oxidoreductase subunit M